MKLYITSQKPAPLSGICIDPKYMGLKVTHLTLASQEWDALYIELDECIPEGSLRFLPQKCKCIRALCPERLSMHQLHLLVELYPSLDGKLRKAYMKGEDVRELLPQVWEHGSEA